MHRHVFIHTHIHILLGRNSETKSQLFINALMKYLLELKSTWALTTQYPHLTTVTCPFIQNLLALHAIDTEENEANIAHLDQSLTRKLFYYSKGQE